MSIIGPPEVYLVYCRRVPLRVVFFGPHAADHATEEAADGVGVDDDAEVDVPDHHENHEQGGYVVQGVEQFLVDHVLAA